MYYALIKKIDGSREQGLLFDMVQVNAIYSAYESLATTLAIEIYEVGECIKHYNK